MRESSFGPATALQQGRRFETAAVASFLVDVPRIHATNLVQWIAMTSERREVPAVLAARASPARGLEIQEVRPTETPRQTGTVYLPATTVPPTVVALRPKRAETAAREPGPLVGPVPRCQIPTMQIIPSNA